MPTPTRKLVQTLLTTAVFSFANFAPAVLSQQADRSQTDDRPTEVIRFLLVSPCLHSIVESKQRKARPPIGRRDNYSGLRFADLTEFSPSTQTSPSAKISFFQIGTVRLSSRMAHSQASNAARRCGALTAITTLVSPISIWPVRWTMPMCAISKRSWASRPSRCNSLQGHRRVSFVDQVKRSASARPLAGVTVQGDGGAAFGQDDAPGNGANVDWVGS